MSKKIRSCKFWVPKSLWHFPPRLFAYFCSGWLRSGLCPNPCFWSAWNRRHRRRFWSQLTLYQNVNVIFYSHIKQPSGLVCLKSSCGVFVLFWLEQSLRDSWLLVGENLGLTSRSEALHCRLSAGSAELRCLGPVAFSLQRVWSLQLVPLSLAPHILITLARMCKGVPEKTVHWNVFFCHVYLCCRQKVSGVWKEMKGLGFPREIKSWWWLIWSFSGSGTRSKSCIFIFVSNMILEKGAHEEI